jgi:hypothetical protein
MNRTCSPAALLRLLALVFVVPLSACDGGAIVFDAGNKVYPEIAENTQGAVWTAKIQKSGSVKTQRLAFYLSGPDASLFALDARSGAVSFNIPADYETPLDTDKNNEYQISIEAKLDDKVAVQQVFLKVNNVSQPMIELVKPKPYENVGIGEPLEVQTQVRFYDAESNTAFADARVEINAASLERSTDDPQMWQGKIKVPQGGIDLSIEGLRAKSASNKFTTSLWNKLNAIKPAGFGSFDGNFVSLLGTKFGAQSRLNLVDNVIQGSNGVFVDRLGLASGFHPRLPFLYVLIEPPTKPEQWDFKGLYALSSFSQPLQEGIEFEWLRYPLDTHALAVDSKNNRVIVVAEKSPVTGNRNVSISAVAINSRGYFAEKTPQFMFSLAAIPVDATLKHFAVDGAAKTYIFAYERRENGQVKTLIQGFGENGAKRFEAQLGPDISNLAVHETAGLIYVAENSGSASAKIKRIDTATGTVTDLLPVNSEIPHGAYTGLGLDEANNRLYIGDAVSDAIYVLDLSGMLMREILYSFVPFIDPVSTED